MATNSIERRKALQAKVGVFGVGFWKYWDQFEGLLDELHEKQKTLRGKLEKLNVQVHDFGMVDDAESPYALVPRLKAAD